MACSPTRAVLCTLYVTCALLGSRPPANAEEEPRDFGPAATAAKLLASPLKRILRLGKAALPSILERKARSARIMDKGVCELFISAVTGKADPAVVRGLFAGGDNEKSLACTIVVWADSKEWKPQLEAVLRVSAEPSREPSHTAALALAACHRKEALPALQAHHRANPNAGRAISSGG